MSTARLLELATSTATPGCAPCQRLAARVDTPPPALVASPDDPATLPLRIVFNDVGEHDNAITVGTIDSITRKGSEIRATGAFDLGSADGIEAQRHVAEGVTTGVSVDVDEVAFEVRVRQELLQAMDEEIAALLDDGDMPAPPEAGPDGRVTVAQGQADDEMFVVQSGRIRAATLVPIPAFANATIALDPADPSRWSGVLMFEGEPTGDGRMFEPNSVTWTLAAAPPKPPDAPAGVTPDGTACSCTEGDPDYNPGCQCGETPAPVAASAAPVRPPLAWFSDPKLPKGHSGLSITEAGRISGRAAEWDIPHIGYPGQPVYAPRSPSNYAHFRTGRVRTAEGVDVPTGRITFDTRHADRSASANATVYHYEHTGACVADVVAGEDEYGIWVAGALRPGATDEQIRVLRGSPLSGDWRSIGGQLEMVAVLSVNVGGFAIPAPAGLVAGGQVQSLVAAGMVLPPASRDVRVRLPKRATVDVAAMRRRVTAAQLSARVHV